MQLYRHTEPSSARGTQGGLLTQPHVPGLLIMQRMLLSDSGLSRGLIPPTTAVLHKVAIPACYNICNPALG